MNPIASAMAAGYSAQEILKFLGNTFPDLVPRIAKATASGYSAAKVLEFLSKTMDDTYMPKNLTPNQINAYQLKQAEDLTKGMAKMAGIAAGSALGTYALSRALPSGTAAAAQAAPNPAPASPQAPAAGPGTPQAAPASPTPQAPTVAPTPQLQGATPQPQGTPPPAGSGTQGPAAPVTAAPPELELGKLPPKKAEALLNKMGMADKVKQMSSTPGNTPQKIADFLEFMKQDKSLPMKGKDIEKMLKQNGVTMQELVESYVGPQEKEAEIAAPEVSKPAEPEQLLVGHEAPEHGQPGSLAATAQGDVGEIKSVKDGMATIVVDGKEKTRKVDELEAEPEAIKKLDLRKMALDYKNSIPESERSAAMVLNFAMPMSALKGEIAKPQPLAKGNVGRVQAAKQSMKPSKEKPSSNVDRMHALVNNKPPATANDSQAVFMIRPNNPDVIYMHPNVPRSLYELINSASVAPSTSGETVLGEWSKEVADSRGSPATLLSKYEPIKIELGHNLAGPLFRELRDAEKDRKAAIAAENKRKRDEDKAAKRKKPGK